MEVIGLLSLGFLIGMGHALEADHLAAVATLNDGPASKRRVTLRGTFWGLGHSIALMLICGLVILSGIAIDARIEAGLEMFVGLVIVFLGLQVVRRMRRRNVHFHVHEHDGRRHIHAHRHDHHGASGRDHAADSAAHRHAHATRSNMVALAVGLLHGAAGSGALLVLLVATTHSVVHSLLYVGLFGLGSIVGMAALSVAASMPLAYLQRGAGWMQKATAAAIAGFAFWTGGRLVGDSVQVLSQLAG